MAYMGGFVATPKPFDYRTQLLRAVRGYLEGTTASRARAKRILATCPPIKPFTIGSMVWGSILSALGDSVFQDDRDYLERLLHFLLGTSHLIRQGFLSYDLRSDMTPQAHDCYGKLQETLDFLERFPFSDIGGANAEYERRQEELETTLASLTETGHDDTETIYHLVLREVAAVVLNIDIRLSFVAHHLAPTEYVSMHPYQKPPVYPDATNSIKWARKALLSIAGQDWLNLSWRFSDEGLWLSLR